MTYCTPSVPLYKVQAKVHRSDCQVFPFRVTCVCVTCRSETGNSRRVEVADQRVVLVAAGLAGVHRAADLRSGLPQDGRRVAFVIFDTAEGLATAIGHLFSV